MRTLFLTSLLAALMGLISVNATAHDIEVPNADGVTIYYVYSNADSTEVAVSYRGKKYRDYSNSYYNDVIIPEIVTFSGKTMRVTSITMNAFRDCHGLQSVVIPNSVTTIGMNAFQDCRGLFSITIPNSVTNIDPYVFKNCQSLTTFIIPEGITSIAHESFLGCSSLSSIKIPGNVTSIGYGAFSGCSRLKDITIPESVTNIGSDAFAGTPWCENQPDGLIYIGPVAYKYKGTMPDNTSLTFKEGTQSISGSAFKNCRSLMSVIIPNSVTCIGDSAFYSCTGLTSITIPEGVATIGKFSFAHCTCLKTISIPNSVTIIDAAAFYWCYSITTVIVDLEKPLPITSFTFDSSNQATLYVPAGCKAAYEAADYWKNFKEIIEKEEPLPIISFADANVKAICLANWDTNGDNELDEDEVAAVTSLGSVFKGNTMIQTFDELKFFTGLKSISRQAFSGCSSLTSIAIPKTVTSVGDEAFYGCKALKEVHIDDLTAWCQIQFTPYQSNPLSVARHLFLDGEAISQLSVPAGISQINISAFQNCEDLVSVILPNSVTSIGMNAFNGCMNLSTVDLGEAITVIGDGAFCGCVNLQEVTLPSCLEILRPNAFAGSGLTIIVIGEGVKEIWQSVFSGCKNLTTVWCLSPTVPTTNDLAFQSSPIENATIYVPASAIENYKSQSPWNHFKEIVALDKDVLLGDVNGDDRVDLTDAIMIVYHSLGQQQEGFNEAAADVNGDGNIDLTDAIIVVYKSLGVQ